MSSQRRNEPLAESQQQQNRRFIGSVVEIGEFAALNGAPKKNNNNIKSKYPVEILVGRKENRTMAPRHKNSGDAKQSNHNTFGFYTLQLKASLTDVASHTSDSVMVQSMQR